MRPNLMSPRRTITSGEDSILAMLEREPARMRAGGTSGTRLVWYGAGAGVALALTGALVWLAANNDGLRPEVQETILADAGKAPHAQPAAATEAAAPAMPPAPVRQLAMATAAVVAETPPGSAAVIVDQRPPAEAVPPLRLLKPAPEKALQEKAAREKADQERPTPALRVPVPVRAPASAAPPAAAPSVAKAATPSRPAAAVPSPAKPAAASAAAASPAPAKPKPALVAKNAVRPVPPKTQRSVNPARTGDGTVDADVALISAVIVHANGHAPEGSQMTELLCANDNCKSRPARD